MGIHPGFSTIHTQSMTVKNFIEACFKGISQVFLIENVITGVFFLTGIFYHSRCLGMGAVFGALVGTGQALLLKYKSDDIRQGLYGYNSTLVCLAIFYFFGLTIPALIASFLGATLSVFITNIMRRAWRLPTFTAPFIVSTWIVMSALLTFRFAPLQTSPLPMVNTISMISALSLGVGQVMFLEDVVAGLILFIGILVGSRVSALYAVMGTALGVAMSIACSLPTGATNLGLFGFNGVLCGIALAERKWGQAYWAMAAMSVSTFMVYGMLKFGIISLTSPFVISTWGILLIKHRFR
jgi:urea transporter